MFSVKNVKVKSQDKVYEKYSLLYEGFFEVL